ncbi:MAG: CRTAC1 family protein [Phycisphaerae bacterium]
MKYRIRLLLCSGRGLMSGHGLRRAMALRWLGAASLLVAGTVGLVVFILNESPPLPAASRPEAPTAPLRRAPLPAPPESEAIDRPWFREVGMSWHLDFVHCSGHETRRWFPEIMCGGVCVLDFDGDGLMDVYFVQGGSLNHDAASGAGNRLFRNLGHRSFEDVTTSAGVGDTSYGMGCACGDYDADGRTDLYVTNVGANVLYHNNGDGSFTEVTASAGVGDVRWGSSAAFVDLNRDGRLDLWVTNYVNWSREGERPCLAADGRSDYCSPMQYSPVSDVLYQNLGQGRFADISEQAGLRRAVGNGLGVAIADFNQDGIPDVYVANDQVANQLWINDGDAAFVDESLLSGCAFNRVGSAEAGMGVQAADVDDDGDWDMFLSHWRNESNTLYRNQGAFFEDATNVLGLAAPSVAYTGFGLGMADFNHDSRPDVFVANGRVSLFEPLCDALDPYAEPDLLLSMVGHNAADAGRFEEILPKGGTRTPLVATSRGTALADLDNDGDIDIIVVNKDARAHLLENTVAGGNWITFRAVNEHGSDAIGATLRLQAGDLIRYALLQPAYGYLSSNDPRVHFGLAARDRVDEVAVTWPDGATEAFGPFAAGRQHELRKGKGKRP